MSGGDTDKDGKLLPDQERSITYNWMWGGKDSGWSATKGDSFVGSYNLVYYPYFAFYWQSHGVDEHFEASKFSAASSNRRADNLIAALKQYFPGWEGPKETQGYAGGDFVSGTTSVHDRMEIEFDFTNRVATLDVPLVRTNGFDRVYTNVLQAVCGSATQSVDVVWNAGVAATNAAVRIPGGMKVGELMALTLFDRDRAVVSTNRAICVQSENSPSNPAWGDEPFDIGEWTMNLAAATQKVANLRGTTKGGTLVLTSGVLWCPHCKGLERQVLDTKPFREFARDSQLALVCLDNPRRPTGDVSCPTGAPPTLLRHQLGIANTANGRKGSGVAYMTRHGVSVAEAEETLRRNHSLGYEAISKGGFRPFEFVRSPYPTVTLLNREGRIVGHLPGKADGGVATETRYPWVEDPVAKTNDIENVKGDNVSQLDVPATMARLRELVEMAERDITVYNADATTLPESSYLEVGRSGDGTLSPNHLTEMWCVTGSAARVKVEIRGDRDGPVSLSFYQGDPGSLRRVGDSVSGSLAAGVVATAPTKGLPLWISVQADPTTNAPAVFSPYTTAEDPFRPYDISTSAVRVPDYEEEMVELAALLEEIELYLMEDLTYSFKGEDSAKIATMSETFEVIEDGLYRSKVTGLVNVPLEIPAGAKEGDVKEFSYMHFELAQVGFVLTEASFPEDCGHAKFHVGRLNDSVGAVEADVYYVPRAGDADPRRYVFEESAGWRREILSDGATTNWLFAVDWAEGDLSPLREVPVKICQDTVAFGTESLEFKLIPRAGARTETVAGRETFTATLTDDDIASVGVLAIVGAKPAFSRNMEVVAVEGSDLQFVVERQIGTDMRAKAVLVMSRGGEVVATSDEAVWETRETDVLRTLSFTVPDFADGAEVSVSLLPRSDIPVRESAATVRVRILPFGVPSCTSDCAGSTAVQGVMFSRAYQLADPHGGRLRVVKKTGALPSGLSGAMSADGTSFTVTGTPLVPGDYAATYQVLADRNGAKDVAGATFDVRVEVVDLLTGVRERGIDAPEFVQALSFEDVYLLADADPNEAGATGRLWGLLNVTLPVSGRASAKLVCERGTFSYAASGWSGAAQGKLTVDLTAVASPAAGRLTVTVDNSNQAEVTLALGDQTVGPFRLVGQDWTETSAAPWVGAYSVQLPQHEAQSTRATGDAYLALRLSTNAVGRMLYAGSLPNGRSVSGRAVLAREGDDVLLPFFRQVTGAAGYVFSGLLRIEPDGAKILEGKTRCIAPEAEGYPRLVRQDIDGETSLLDAYGSFYDGKIAERCQRVSLDSHDLLFGLNAGSLGVSDAFLGVGANFTTDAALAVTGINPHNVRFSFDAESGVVSGSFDLPLADGRMPKASFKGIVMPGWPSPNGCSDCGAGSVPSRPLMSGACWFTETGDGSPRGTVNGCGVWIDGKKED